MTLDIADLTVCFGERRVLDGLSLSLRTGETVAVVGSSGAGKSTLLRCILGAQRPDSGSVLVAGQSVMGVGEPQLRALRSKHLGMVFQNGELIGELDAVENVALPLLMRGCSVEQAMHQARGLLRQLGVETQGVVSDRLSGGERQRTALARALIGKPSLVLADEPTGALDAATRDEVADLLVQWCVRFESALLLVTHDPVVAARADRVMVLEDGVLASVSLAAP